MKKQNLVFSAFLALSLSMPLFAQETNNNDITTDATTPTNTTNSAAITTENNIQPASNEVVNNITFLKDESSLTQYLESNKDKPTFIFVYASWCGWCKKERPILETLAPKRDDVNIVAINYETAPDLVKKYKINGFPSYVTIKDDKSSKDIGFLRKSDLNQLISTNIKKVNKTAKMNY